MTIIKRLSELNDQIGFIVLSAPDRFKSNGPFGSDQQKNLLIAFDMLQEAFPLVERKIKDADQLLNLKRLLADALEAYKQGERKKGAFLLQDFQNIVFPNRFKEYEMRKSKE